METTRLHSAERPLATELPGGVSVLSGDAAAFGDSLRREHQRLLSAIGDASARLAHGDRALAATAALQFQLTRQFLDAQRSILLRHAEAHAEIQRIEREAEADADRQLASARRRAVAMSAHPASGDRAAQSAPALVGQASGGAPADPGAMAEIVDLVFQPTEPEGSTARRQLTALLDDWWTAEQQEARARIDDAYARAAMRRHVAGIEAAELVASFDGQLPADAPVAGRDGVPALPRRMCGILDSAAAVRLDDVLDELLAALDESPTVTAMVQPGSKVPEPPLLADGAILRFEPSPVLAGNGSDEAFQRFWTKEAADAPARRTRWWHHVAIIVPATAVSSLLVVAIAWVG